MAPIQRHPCGGSVPLPSCSTPQRNPPALGSQTHTKRRVTQTEEAEPPGLGAGRGSWTATVFQSPALTHKDARGHLSIPIEELGAMVVMLPVTSDQQVPLQTGDKDMDAADADAATESSEEGPTAGTPWCERRFQSSPRQ